MTKKPFHFRITDHVLLRYMERMLGVDVSDFRKRLHDKLEPAARAGAASTETAGMIFKFNYHTDGGATACTMWPADSLKPKLKPREGRQDSKEYQKITARKRMAK